MIADLHFGIIASECILRAAIVEPDPHLDALKQQWSKFGVTLDELRCYRIETSSTASVIKIFAKHCEVAGTPSRA
jgi:hypothetical protein